MGNKLSILRGWALFLPWSILVVLALVALLHPTHSQENRSSGPSVPTPRETPTVSMKDPAELRSVWTRLAEKVDEDPDTQERIAIVFEGYLQTSVPPTEELVWQQLYRLLSDPNANSLARREALRLFVDVEAKEVLRQVVLTPVDQSGGRDFIGTASRALGRMKDEEALPSLVHVLSANNYIQIGSDTATAHIIMKSRLMGAIRAITGIGGETDNMDINEITDLDQFNQAIRAACDPREAEQLISEAQAWAIQQDIELIE